MLYWLRSQGSWQQELAQRSKHDSMSQSPSGLPSALQRLLQHEVQHGMLSPEVQVYSGELGIAMHV